MHPSLARHGLDGAVHQAGEPGPDQRPVLRVQQVQAGASDRLFRVQSGEATGRGVRVEDRAGLVEQEHAGRGQPERLAEPVVRDGERLPRRCPQRQWPGEDQDHRPAVDFADGGDRLDRDLGAVRGQEGVLGEHRVDGLAGEKPRVSDREGRRGWPAVAQAHGCQAGRGRRRRSGRAVCAPPGWQTSPARRQERASPPATARRGHAAAPRSYRRFTAASRSVLLTCSFATPGNGSYGLFVPLPPRTERTRADEPTGQPGRRVRPVAFQDAPTSVFDAALS